MSKDLGASADADRAATPSGPSPSVSGVAGIPSAEDVRAVVNMLDPQDFEPFVKRAADEIYNRVMDCCEDYLRENVEWNISSHISMLERENQRMRLELHDVDRALGCLSLGPEARIAAIRETQERFNQASNEAWRLRSELASAMSASGQDPKGLEAKPASAARSEAKGDANA